MALAVITVNSPASAMASRAAELAFIQRAMRLAEIDMRGAGGSLLSGEIRGDGQILLGAWTYGPQASS